MITNQDELALHHEVTNNSENRKKVFASLISFYHEELVNYPGDRCYVNLSFEILIYL